MSAICGQGELDQKIREKNETNISNFKETLHTLCKKNLIHTDLIIIENEPPNNKLISDDYSPDEEAWTN